MAILEEKEELLVRAKIAEQVERFDDMAAAMKKYVELSSELKTDDERNLFSIAYKCQISQRRSSWRVICSIEDKLTAQGLAGKLQIANKCRKSITEDLCCICNEAIGLLDTYLIKKPSDSECEVFYLKLKADYFRYLAEVLQGDEQNAAADQSEKAYKTAVEIAFKNFHPTDASRLGLALNYSCFLYEIKSDAEEACKFAKQAFDDAMADLDTLNEDSYKNSTFVMQVLRDNLTLWANEAHEATEGVSVDADAC